jgi:hypothetical protein
MKIFSPLGVAYIAAESNFRELLEIVRFTQNTTKPVVGSRGQALERKYNYFI